MHVRERAASPCFLTPFSLYIPRVPRVRARPLSQYCSTTMGFTRDLLYGLVGVGSFAIVVSLIVILTGVLAPATTPAPATPASTFNTSLSYNVTKSTVAATGATTDSFNVTVVQSGPVRWVNLAGPTTLTTGDDFISFAAGTIALTDLPYMDVSQPWYEKTVCTLTQGFPAPFFDAQVVLFIFSDGSLALLPATVRDETGVLEPDRVGVVRPDYAGFDPFFTGVPGVLQCNDAWITVGGTAGPGIASRRNPRRFPRPLPKPSPSSAGKKSPPPAPPARR